ncbi:hypothetical protein BC829DRAFT_378784 [Chytridium lagenaria]|nr:hypothetical protein BC829DRAFT_378784 [Chytridium lagenaria]
MKLVAMYGDLRGSLDINETLRPDVSKRTSMRRKNRPSLTMVQALPLVLPKRMMEVVEIKREETREEILGTAGTEGCRLTTEDCLLWSKAVDNPLVLVALESGKFSYDALDFLHLCLRWNPKYRPTIAELLHHPYVSIVDYVVP